MSAVTIRCRSCRATRILSLIEWRVFRRSRLLRCCGEEMGLAR